MRAKKACAFTGHRPEKLPWGNHETDPRCLACKEAIWQAVQTAYKDGFRVFLSGMARGGDWYFCQAVLRLKQEHPRVQLVSVIPFRNQAKLWSEAEQAYYKRLLAQCNTEHLMQEGYTRGCLLRRNRYLVEHSERLIALYNGRDKGGTLYTIKHAISLEKDWVLLDVPQ